MSDDGFLARWSRRKQQAQRGEPLPAEPTEPAAPAAEAAPAPARAAPPATAAANAAPASIAAPADAAAPPPAPPPPTLDDVAALTRESDFSRFVRPDVDEDVKRAAMKKLFFSDPHFNTMDGLDVYIDDYSKPDPIPAAMLRKMVQSQALGLFDDEKPAAPEAGAPRDAARDSLSPPAQGETALPPDAAGADNRGSAAGSGAAPHDTAAPPAAEPAPDEDADLRLQQDDAAGRGGGEPPGPGAAEGPAGQR